MDSNADPIGLFKDWYDEWQSVAPKHDVQEPTAVTLATADANGRPSVRVVLLKGFGPEGFVFYTNLESTKGQQLAINPMASMCFYWDQLEKQIRLEGKVIAVTPEEADRYFASRAKDSQIGAWASLQSQKMSARGDLAKRVATFTVKYGLGSVPRPPHWSGFRVVPDRIEFWHKRKFRLHDRFCFNMTSEGVWTRSDLYP